MSHGTVALMWTSSSLTAPEPDHIVLLVPCQPSTGLFPRNGHPVEDCTAEEPMDELTVEPDAEEPRRKRTRCRKGAVHVSRTRKTMLNRQITTTQRSKGCRRNVQNASSKRPTRVGEKSVDQWFVVELSVVETSAPLRQGNVNTKSC